MKKTMRVGWLMIFLLLLTACQQASVPGRDTSGESRYAEKQMREAYINTPAFINVQLGIAYMSKGDLNLALSKFKKALFQSPQLAIAHSSIAVLYERLGEYELAESHYIRSISLDPNDSRLRNNYGKFLCGHRDVRQAIEQFDIAAANPLYQTPYRPKVNAGMCALKINDLELAGTYLRDALKLQPRLAPALASMIGLSIKQQQYAQGKAYMKRYLQVARHSADTLWAGYLIEKNLGDKAAADNYAVRLKTRHPDSEQTRRLLKEINSR